MSLWQQLKPSVRRDDLASRKASITRLENELDIGARNRNADFIPIYRALVELIEQEEARIAGLPWPPPHRWLAQLKRLSWCFVVAAALLFPLDALQVLRGVETGNATWLTPIRFGLVGVVLGLLAPRIDPRPHPLGKLGIGADALVFVLSYIGTLWRPDNNLAALAAMGMMFLIRALSNALLWRELWPFFLLLGLGGPFVEILGVQFGSFSYAHPSFLGIPAWLPFLWLNGSFLARDLFSRARPE